MVTGHSLYVSHRGKGEIQRSIPCFLCGIALSVFPALGNLILLGNDSIASLIDILRIAPADEFSRILKSLLNTAKNLIHFREIIKRHLIEVLATEFVTQLSKVGVDHFVKLACVDRIGVSFELLVLILQILELLLGLIPLELGLVDASVSLVEIGVAVSVYQFTHLKHSPDQVNGDILSVRGSQQTSLQSSLEVLDLLPHSTSLSVIYLFLCHLLLVLDFRLQPVDASVRSLILTQKSLELCLPCFLILTMLLEFFFQGSLECRNRLFVLTGLRCGLRLQFLIGFRNTDELSLHSCGLTLLASERGSGFTVVTQDLALLHLSL